MREGIRANHHELNGIDGEVGIVIKMEREKFEDQHLELHASFLQLPFIDIKSHRFMV